MATDRRVTFLIGANIDRLRRNLNTASRRLDRFGRRTQRLGRSMTRWLTTPILAVGGASLKMAGDFQQSMTRIETLVGASRTEVDRMRGSVVELSNETGRSAKELSEALFTVTSAGARGAEAMEVLERAAKASAVGLGETRSIAQAVTAAMQAYGSENLNAAQATDTLTAIVREGNLEAESLAPTLGRVIGLASQLGISFSEVGASIATYTRLGVSAEEATTGLRSIMNTLIKPTNDSREALSEIGLTFEELRRQVQEEGLAVTMNRLITEFGGNEEALSRLIPNVRALSAVLGTAGSQGQEYERIQRSIANSTGIVNDGFERTSEDALFKYNRAIERLKNQWIETGDLILPIAGSIMDRLGNVVERFSQMDEEGRKMAITIGVVTAAVGPLTFAIGGLTRAIALLLSPVMAKIAAMAGIVTALEYVRRNTDAFKNFFHDTWLEIKNFVVDSVVDMLGAIEQFVGWLPNASGSLLAASAAAASFREEVPDREDGYGFQEFGEFIEDVSDSVIGRLRQLQEMLFRVTSAAREARKEAEGVANMAPTRGVEGETTGSTAGDISDMETPGSTLMQAVEGAQRLPALLRRSNEELQASIALNRRLGQVSSFMMEITTNWADSFGNGMANLVVQGGKFVDVLNNMKRLFASQLISSGISAILTGGLGGSGFFGSGGGLLGKIFNDVIISPNGNVIGTHPDDFLIATKDPAGMADNIRASAGNTPGKMNLSGEFRIKGTDLVLALEEANYTLR